MIQATGGKQPLLKTGIQNNLPMILGDGVDDVLRVTFTNFNDPTTIFAAIKTPGSLPGANKIWLATKQAGGHYLRFTLGDAWSINTGSDIINDGIPAINTAYVITGCWDGASSLIRKNGTPTTGALTASNTNMLTVFADDGGSPTYMNIYIGEVILCAVHTAAANITAVERYLGAKWGIAVA